MRKTDWFPAHVKPARVGVYERDYGKTEGLGVVYAHWDGTRWGVFGRTPQNAVDMRALASAYPRLPWRGLAAPATQATEGAK